MMCLSGLGAQGVPIALAICPPLRWTPEQAFRQRLAQLKTIRRELCLSRGIFLIEISALQNHARPALEHRNCFVAITRTLQSLTMSYAATYNGWTKRPSRFLGETGLDLI